MKYIPTPFRKLLNVPGEVRLPVLLIAITIIGFLSLRGGKTRSKAAEEMQMEMNNQFDRFQKQLNFAEHAMLEMQEKSVAVDRASREMVTLYENSQKELISTQKALLETQNALRSTQEALAEERKYSDASDGGIRAELRSPEYSKADVLPLENIGKAEEELIARTIELEQKRVALVRKWAGIDLAVSRRSIVQENATVDNLAIIFGYKPSFLGADHRKDIPFHIGSERTSWYSNELAMKQSSLRQVDAEIAVLKNRLERN